MSGVHSNKVDGHCHIADHPSNIRRAETVADVLRIHRDNNIRQASNIHDEINGAHRKISDYQKIIDELRVKHDLLKDYALQFEAAILIIEGSDASLEPVMVADTSEADFLRKLEREEIK